MTADVQKEGNIRVVQVRYHLDSPASLHDKEAVGVAGRTYDGGRAIEAQPGKGGDGCVLVRFQRERQRRVCHAGQFGGQNSLFGGGFDKTNSKKREQGEPAYSSTIRHRNPFGILGDTTSGRQREALIGR